jgi:hypothetical protein
MMNPLDGAVVESDTQAVIRRTGTICRPGIKYTEQIV